MPAGNAATRREITAATRRLTGLAAIPFLARALRTMGATLKARATTDSSHVPTTTAEPSTFGWSLSPEQRLQRTEGRLDV